MNRRVLHRCFVAFIVLSSFFALQCFGRGAADAQQELLVSAAASLTNAFTDLGKQFETANPGVKAIFNFGASGALLQQIDKGAPVDVFASADQKTMDQAKEKNLILTETRKDFVSNGLVLIIPNDSKVALKGVKDLADPKIVRIALGNPESVPAGRTRKKPLPMPAFGRNSNRNSFMPRMFDRPWTMSREAKWMPASSSQPMRP